MSQVAVFFTSQDCAIVPLPIPEAIAATQSLVQAGRGSLILAPLVRAKAEDTGPVAAAYVMMNDEGVKVYGADTHAALIARVREDFPDIEAPNDMMFQDYLWERAFKRGWRIQITDARLICDDFKEITGIEVPEPEETQASLPGL